MNGLIKQYVSNITIDNIYDFGRKNNIFLNEKELNVLYDIVKRDYQKLLAGDVVEIKNQLKESLTEENYSKVINLYDMYYQRYQGYLW